MAYQPGCQGRVVVGALPESVQRELVAIPGDWLEYDPPSRSIIVRHIEPTDEPVLPAVTVELVRILSVSKRPAAWFASASNGEVRCKFSGPVRAIPGRRSARGAMVMRS
jgi:hypothetical protein